MNKPQVSVLLPAYNHELYVRQTIESVIRQTYTNFEFLIYDDASSDLTPDIIRSFAKKDERIRLFISEKNHGTVHALNTLLKAVEGDYIAVIGSDDAWHPEKLEKQVRYLEEHPQFAACFTGVQLIDDDGEILTESARFPMNVFSCRNMDKADLLYRFFEDGNHFCHASALIRRSVHDEIGLYHPAYRQLHDYDLWIRILLKYDVWILQEKLTLYRVVETSESLSRVTSEKKARLRSEAKEIYTYLLERISDEDFIRGFSDRFENPQAKTWEELVCEKFFLLQKQGVFGEPMPSLANAFLLSHLNDAVLAVLSGKYGISQSQVEGLTAVLEEEHDALSLTEPKDRPSPLDRQSEMLEERKRKKKQAILEKDGDKKMDKDLFSIILLHYNQPRYVKQALDSVLLQNYENIELVFADDASHNIDLPWIQSYIEENKGDNIKNVIYSINPQNVGTVKTVKRAVEQCSGKYILFFAADDALCNEDVISHFAQAFEKADDNVYMISSQCHMMDEKMHKELYSFVKPTFAVSFNNMTAREQFKAFCGSCMIAIGSTAMRKDMFEKFGPFNEEYKFIEDWSYFLHLTRNGGLIRYADFDGLYHRDGGVSHYTDTEKVPAHVLAYKYDMVRIFEREVLPYVKQFGAKMISHALVRYTAELSAYRALGGTGRSLSKFRLTRMFPSFYIQTALLPITEGWHAARSVTKASLHLFLFGIALLVMGFIFADVRWLSNVFVILARVYAVLFLCAAIALLGIFVIRYGLLFLKKIKKLFKGRGE